MGLTTPPSWEPARGARGRPGPVRLPSGGRAGPAPRWPLSVPPTPAERKAWRDLWRSPQAVAWERQGCRRVVARYCLVMVEAEQPSASAQARAEARQLEERLGLTPVALRMLLWTIEPAEVVPLVSVAAP